MTPVLRLLNTELTYYTLHTNPFQAWVLVFDRRGQLIAGLSPITARDLYESSHARRDLHGGPLVQQRRCLQPHQGSCPKDVTDRAMGMGVLVAGTSSGSTLEDAWIDISLNPWRIPLSQAKRLSAIVRRHAPLFPMGGALVDSFPDAHGPVESLVRSLPQPRVVVDLGSGGGAYRRLFRDPGTTYVAVEPNAVWCPRQIRQPVTGPRFWAVRASGDSLPLRAGAADLVLCLFVLEHVCDVESVVAEMGRVLGPDGHAIIGVPCLSLLGELDHKLLRCQVSLYPEHMRVFSIWRHRRSPVCSLGDLRRLLWRHGLSLSASWSRGTDADVPPLSRILHPSYRIMIARRSHSAPEAPCGDRPPLLGYRRSPGKTPVSLPKGDNSVHEIVDSEAMTARLSHAFVRFEVRPDAGFLPAQALAMALDKWFGYLCSHDVNPSRLKSDCHGTGPIVTCTQCVLTDKPDSYLCRVHTALLAGILTPSRPSRPSSFLLQYTDEVCLFRVGEVGHTSVSIRDDS